MRGQCTARGLTMLLATSLACAVSASAATVSLRPVDQMVAPGGQALVDLVAADLPATGIGSFDFTIQYDSSFLQFVSVSFGDRLGDPALQLNDAVTGANSVNVSEVSFEPVTTLQGLQGLGPITLATLRFNTVAGGGATTLTFGTEPFAVANGAGDLVGSTAVGASISIVGVPEPSFTLLLASSLSALLLVRRGRPGIALAPCPVEPRVIPIAKT